MSISFPETPLPLSARLLVTRSVVIVTCDATTSRFKNTVLQYDYYMVIYFIMSVVKDLILTECIRHVQIILN